MLNFIATAASPSHRASAGVVRRPPLARGASKAGERLSRAGIPSRKRGRVTEARRTVEIDDATTISYSVFDGAEPAIVVLHGLAGSSREFVATARALASRKVILIDQRGHGFSTRIPADTSRAAFVSDVVRVIEVEGSLQVDLVGQSMGAHTAMLVAAAHPKLVRRLVLLEGDAGSGSPEDHAALGDYFRAWKVPFASRDEAGEALGDGPLAQAWMADLEERKEGFYPRFDADVMVRAIAEVAVPRWSEWESITQPTLVVYADGGMFSEEQKAEFVARGRNVTRVDLTGASHDAHLNAFEQWSIKLRGFLTAGD
ncbi:alpha/beta fold hydrolase [Leifsonia sp. NPDC056824]|uniref:alpha/beta fold hydrolase n=1 Tax=Leifsonia sp. NPDC056824 TaxID=3345953 RepID=UPI003681A485